MENPLYVPTVSKLGELRSCPPLLFGVLTGPGLVSLLQLDDQNGNDTDDEEKVNRRTRKRQNMTVKEKSTVRLRSGNEANLNKRSVISIKSNQGE